MFGSLGVPELLIILVIVVVLFGANKMARLGRGLGEGIKNFKDSVRSDASPESESNEKNNADAVDPS